MLTSKELAEAADSGEIDTVVVCFPDMQGRLVGKRCQAEYFLDGAHEGIHACNYLLANDIDMEPVPGYAVSNVEKGYGDFVMKPDLGTLRRIPWLPATALVLCDIVEPQHHEALTHSPRAMLKRQIARLGAKGMSSRVASELEFYLFDETYDGAQTKGWQNLKTTGSYIQDYHVFQSTKEEGVLRAMRKGLQGAGIRVETSRGEWGPGQEEINVGYTDAVSMADWHVILKNGCKEIAYSMGKAITFLAKWRYDLAGSSCHIHASLWDAAGNTPLFFDPQEEHGMSSLMRHYLAGQLAYAREITWFLAPYINSYKRIQAGTFSPTKAIWSLDNRTAGFRLCGADSESIRIECRIGGADLNPYLAFSALIAAGLAGIEQKLELEEPYTGNAYKGEELREVPKTLREATELMKNSKMLCSAFGDGVIEHYVHTAEWEQFEYDRRITDWELRRGFERY